MVTVLEKLGYILPDGFLPPPEDTWTIKTEVLPTFDYQGKLHMLIGEKKQISQNPIVLLCFHGFGEHAGRYLHFPAHLSNSIDIFIAVDQRGHGLSEGLRGHIDDFSLFINDLQYIYQWVQNRYSKNIHIFGHSMGGLIVLLASEKLDALSISVSAPALALKMKVPFFKWLGGFLLKNLLPQLQLMADVFPEHLSRDINVLNVLKCDKLVHRKITPRFFFEMDRFSKKILKEQKSYKAPVLFFIPNQDQLIDAAVTECFTNQIDSYKKILKLNSFHEPFQDIERQNAFEELEKWINQWTIRL